MTTPSIFEVDASGGGYLLSTVRSVDSSAPELPERVTQSLGSLRPISHGLMVETLGGVNGDSRVHLSANWSKKKLTPASIEWRSEAFRAACTFEIETPVPIQVLSLAGSVQGVLTPQPGIFTCSVFMRIEDEPREPEGPREVHVYLIAPSEFSEEADRWWLR